MRAVFSGAPDRGGWRLQLGACKTMQTRRACTVGDCNLLVKMSGTDDGDVGGDLT